MKEPLDSIIGKSICDLCGEDRNGEHYGSSTFTGLIPPRYSHRMDAHGNQRLEHSLEGFVETTYTMRCAKCEEQLQENDLDALADLLSIKGWFMALIKEEWLCYCPKHPDLQKKAMLWYHIE